MKLPELILTERQIIRPFQEGDRAEFVRFITTERATRYLPFSEEENREEGANAILDRVMPSYTSDTHVIAREAIEALLWTAFSSLEHPSVVANVHPDDLPPQQLALRVGMASQGVDTHPQLSEEAVLFRQDGPIDP